MIDISLHLNGLLIEESIAEDEVLLDFVRRHGAKSVKRGCDTSNCGLCSVFVGSKIVLSCSTLAYTCDGQEVFTLEGLEAEAAPIRPYIAHQGADQCGFCSPGLIMASIALARDHENPDDDTIRQYLSGNLCRCTGYVSQTRALRKFFDERQAKNDR